MSNKSEKSTSLGPFPFVIPLLHFSMTHVPSALPVDPL